ncbi:hypothetical protein GH714_020367 [Hevea brasiliensis]|uniref:RIC1 C-terminal alpha solenoid region domain-containing protein n=1 Tax=Hevea brasiliensis TaxID=3981 RepID=A0A6A6KUL3_HEVBR|nr:hypothetical protein GH714_020367 [Hevea brasiliensis]
MYMAYGWPQVIPLEPGLCPSSQQIIYLKVINRLLLVVSPSHLELWSSSQHKLRLGKYKRDAESVEREGENLQAVWSPDAKLIAILLLIALNAHLVLLFHILKVQFTEKRIQIGGKQPSGLFLANIALLLSEQVPFVENNLTVSNIVSDSKHMLLGLSNGSLYSMSWKGEFHGAFKLDHYPHESSEISILPCSLVNGLGSGKATGGLVPNHNITRKLAITQLELSLPMRYSMDDTGSVSCIAWTPDNSAFAVGWKLRGLTVWSFSDCRLMSTIRQVGLRSFSSPIFKPKQDCKYEPLMGGTSLIGVSGMTYVRQVIYGEDRLLVVQSEDTDELKILHLNLPVSYISQNWPVQHVAASKDGMYLAIAGLHGLILYDMQLKKWVCLEIFLRNKRFSAKMYETDFYLSVKCDCCGLMLGEIGNLWFEQVDNSYELLFYPRYHLDQSSLLCRKSLLAKPMVMDVYQDHILVTYCPFDVHIFHVKLFGELTPHSTPDLQLSTVRELSIMTAKSHPAVMRFIPDQIPKESALKNYISLSSDLIMREPARCLILRTNGELSLLDLDDGRERELTDSVELVWVTCSQLEEKTNLIEEVSWLDYGHRGMQVWYPSLCGDPFKQEDFLQLDPELEFDREVYPLGLLPNAGVIVGVSQRMSFSTCTEFPCFEPSPQAQTILHCLLRHLLQRDKIEEALRLAQLSAQMSHFSHCLEWLLFTVFDAEISRKNANKNQKSVSEGTGNFSLLEKTCDLIRNFPEYLDVVLSVARKTDGRHWADLFSAAGRSTELFEECFQRRWYRTAACYILVIAKLEGPAVSQYCALRLLQATLDESLYELAGELVRFLLRSGKEYNQASTESDRLSPRFLGYFLFRSSFRKTSLDKSTSFKEQSAYVASVKNILESHASYLMSGKELSKLVPFVKGTQFDLVEYLQRERYGSARLENFASGLELIGQKLQMETLQSRLDAEFLLAHMCSVKFKEWIVVLATLLRRSEVLFDLFRHDLWLWNAYSITLQSHPVFVEYQDLLENLEERLTSDSNLEEK